MLGRFNIDYIQKNCVIEIRGNRLSGKTTLVRNIIHHINNDGLKKVFVFTQWINEFKNITSDELIYHRTIDYDDIIGNILKKQKILFRDTKRKIIIVFDNIINFISPKKHFSELINRECSNHGITIIFVLDNYYGESPFLKNYSFIANDNNNALKLYYQCNDEMTFDTPMSYDAFERQFDLCTMHYGFFVIDNYCRNISLYNVPTEHNTLQHREKIITTLQKYIFDDITNIVTQYLSMIISDRMCLYCS